MDLTNVILLWNVSQNWDLRSHLTLRVNTGLQIFSVWLSNLVGFVLLPFYVLCSSKHWKSSLVVACYVPWCLFMIEEELYVVYMTVCPTNSSCLVNSTVMGIHLNPCNCDCVILWYLLVLSTMIWEKLELIRMMPDYCLGMWFTISPSLDYSQYNSTHQATTTSGTGRL